MQRLAAETWNLVEHGTFRADAEREIMSRWNSKEGIEYLVVVLDTRPDILREAIAEGFDPAHSFFHGESILQVAMRRGPETFLVVLETVQDIDLPGEDGSSALMDAIGIGDCNFLRLLLKWGASVERTDKFDRNSLHHIARLGISEEIAQVVCQLATRSSLLALANDQHTPLTLGIKSGAEAAVEAIIDAHRRVGLDVSQPARPGLLTPLQAAITYRNPSAMRHLLRVGAIRTVIGFNEQSSVEDYDSLPPNDKSLLSDAWSTSSGGSSTRA